MPKVRIKQKDKFDRFYTKEDVAINCVDALVAIVGEHNLFVEPSAGSGNFFRHLPLGKIGIDLFPCCDGVIEHDWLTYNVPKDCVVVGNPPFGSRNSLTKSFIKHASTQASVIAFILPSSYRKETMQQVFTDEWELVYSTELPANSFVFEGEDYHVPCVFQVWLKAEYNAKRLPNIRESVKQKITTSDFSFVKKDDADWFVFGAAPSKIVEKGVVNTKNRGYYLSQHKDGVKERFQEIDWKLYANSSVSGGVAWFTKQEIINIYEACKNENSF